MKKLYILSMTALVLCLCFLSTISSFANEETEIKYSEASEMDYKNKNEDVGEILSQNGDINVKYLYFGYCLNPDSGVSHYYYRNYYRFILENAEKSVTNVVTTFNKDRVTETKFPPFVVNLWSRKNFNYDTAVEIAENAFKDCTLLESFETEPIAYYINQNSFVNCDSLRYIHFAQQKTYIELGLEWFERDKELAEILGNEEGYYVKCEVTYTGNIESNAFVNCKNLSAVVIDNPDMTIQPNAFVNCPNLIIYCKTGSKAEEYAKQNSIPFINTDKADDFDRMVFDYDLFAEKNPEIAANFNGNEEAALAYWLNVGIAKNMTGSHVFNGEYYLAKNADVAKACDNDVVKGYNHFKLYGCNELRKSSFEYCGKAYKQRHSDLSDMTGEQLVKHYVTYGIDEKRNARDEIAVKQSYGDADLDGCITSADASIFMQKALNNGFGIVTDVKYIDVDGDGIITAADASTILQKVRNNGFKMPVEG